MPFFIRNNRNAAKRKGQFKKGNNRKSQTGDAPSKKPKKDEIVNVIESEDSSSEESYSENETVDEDQYCTAQEKKIKLAHKYVEAIENEVNDELEFNGDANYDGTLSRLKDEARKRAGLVKKTIADKIIFDPSKAISLSCKQHKLSITCICVSRDNRFLYSCSKDYSIVRWLIVGEGFQKVNWISLKKSKTDAKDKFDSRLHNCAINCLVLSRDEGFLISGNTAGKINVWKAETLEYTRTLEGHKSSVTSLAVCAETNSLYSASSDGLVKVWNLDEFAYVETLFGHQSEVTSIDVLAKDRVITSGGRDKTLRVWKIREESQLIYPGHSGSIDVVKKLDEGFFVSAGDDGAICLWGALKKKPLFVVPHAHNLHPDNGEPNWITALTVLKNSDLIASGSCDGYVRLWKWNSPKRTIDALSSLPVAGFVNGICFTTDGRFMIVAVGKEHRQGRWSCLKEAKNQIFCFPLTMPPVK